MSDRNIYKAIMIAAAKGKGIRLSEAEVQHLANDDAIMTTAANNLDEKATKEYNDTGMIWGFWRKQKA